MSREHIFRAMWPLLLAVCAAHPLELRVAKALGSKGYGKARVSLVANSTQDAADFHFDYRQPFQYRWTQHALLSSVVELLGEIHRRPLEAK